MFKWCYFVKAIYHLLRLMLLTGIENYNIIERPVKKILNNPYADKDSVHLITREQLRLIRNIARVEKWSNSKSIRIARHQVKMNINLLKSI